MLIGVCICSPSFVVVICAALFHDVTLDIGGFQGRMGLFFFILALFGFSSLTSITIFAEERLIFMRERSNGYYSPLAYFFSKVLFDLVPLRIVPPFILGSMIYYPVGLVAGLEQFWRFVLVLISFNLVAASVVMLVSLVVAEAGVANLLGSLIMLFKWVHHLYFLSYIDTNFGEWAILAWSLLFAGLLVNREKLPQHTGWLLDVSFFHAAFEALLINEVRYLTLKDHRYGVDIEVPCEFFLSTPAWIPHPP